MYQKINFNQVIDEIVLRNECSRATAELFLKTLFAIVVDQLKDGNNVSISGLGEFKKGVDDADLIQFIVDKNLAQFLNQPFSYFEPIELAEGVSEEILNEKTEVHEITVDELINELTKDEPSEKNEIVEDAKKENLLLENESDADSNILKIEETQKCKEIDNEVIIVSEECSETENEEYIENIDTNSEEKKSVKWWKYCIVFIIGFVIGYFAKEQITKMLINEALEIINEEQIDNKAVNQLLIDTLNIHKQEFIDVAKNKVEIDTITKNRFLTTMARNYYGNLHFWVYIYEENKDILGHPDKIKPGTEVVIPPKEKYNINPSDDEAINIARNKSSEIYAKYKKKD